MATTRIIDINNTISGSTLATNTDLCYFVVDLMDGLTYNIDRTLLIKFIKTKGISDGTFGTSCELNYGDDANEIPYFISNNTAAGIVRHISAGGIYTLAANSAFNKSFTSTGGVNGSQSIVARADHTHALLSAISNQYNSHTGTFNFVETSSAIITLDMLLGKMSYTPTKAINPGVLYKLYTYDAGTLTPIANGTYNDSIVSELSLSTQTGNWYKFSLLVLTGLNTSKKYIIVVNFTDDRGYFIQSGGGSS